MPWLVSYGWLQRVLGLSWFCYYFTCFLISMHQFYYVSIFINICEFLVIDVAKLSSNTSTPCTMNNGGLSKNARILGLYVLQFGRGPVTAVSQERTQIARPSGPQTQQWVSEQTELQNTADCCQLEPRKRETPHGPRKSYLQLKSYHNVIQGECRGFWVSWHIWHVGWGTRVTLLEQGEHLLFAFNTLVLIALWDVCIWICGRMRKWWFHSVTLIWRS